MLISEASSLGTSRREPIKTPLFFPQLFSVFAKNVMAASSHDDHEKKQLLSLACYERAEAEGKMSSRLSGRLAALTTKDNFYPEKNKKKQKQKVEVSTKRVNGGGKKKQTAAWAQRRRG